MCGRRASTSSYCASSSPPRSGRWGPRRGPNQNRGSGRCRVQRTSRESRVTENLVVYTVVHQPRRLRLPARVIPAGTQPDDLGGFLFDQEMDRRYFDQVAQAAYLPATAMFRDLTPPGWRMSIAFSNSFLVQAEASESKVLDSFKRLCASPNVEVVCVEPYHSWLFYVDIVEFKESR